jgi:arabinogalactan endo-1,4-beta-galactosidase
MVKIKAVPNGKGIGLLYWEPQCYGGWKSYTLGAFDNSGKPTIALDAFR